MSPSCCDYSATINPIRIPSIKLPNAMAAITPNTSLKVVPIKPNNCFISVPLLEQFREFRLLLLRKVLYGRT